MRRGRQNACGTIRTQKRNDYPESLRPFLTRTQGRYDESPRKTPLKATKKCASNKIFDAHFCFIIAKITNKIKVY